MNSRYYINAVVFPLDGKHVVSGGKEGRIRRWCVEDGKEVGTPMDAGSAVLNIAVSRDEKLIVSGEESGQVMVWNAETHSKVTEFKAHEHPMYAVGVSPDSTRIVTGSDDHTVCVWSLSTGERLLGPLEHTYELVGAKFSPDGRLIATATWERDSVRVYDSQNGDLLVDFPVQVNSLYHQSLAWASDGKKLLALSKDGYIHHFDASGTTVLSKWRIHSNDDSDVKCVALAGNGTFIAASARSSVSLWDTTTREQIGAVIEYTHDIWCMAMSSNYDLVAGGEKKLTLRALCDVVPSHYVGDVSVPAYRRRKNW